jgi:hypothetical protein
MIRSIVKDKYPEIGCTDGACIFGHHGGMCTNGGCHCADTTDRDEAKKIARVLNYVAHALARRVIEAEKVK